MSEQIKQVANCYPELPVIPYEKTSVPMADVIAYLQSLNYVGEVKRAVYVIFRNESANGRSGVNGNYAGVQADGSRWPDKWDKRIIATTVKNENMTGRSRRFVVFNSWKDSVDFLIDSIVARGLYIGGFSQRIAKISIREPKDLARAYYKEWVMGEKLAEPDGDFIKDFQSMYSQGCSLFK